MPHRLSAPAPAAPTAPLDTTSSVSVDLPFVETDGQEAWDALADGTRRAIVLLLAERPHAVGELADHLPVSRPAVSQHLKVLKDAGLVSESPQGTRRIYRLEAAGISALRDQLDTFWRRALEGYADAVGTTNDDPPRSSEDNP